MPHAAALAATYRAHIACLNAQGWAELGRFVHAEVHYNGAPIGLADYRDLLRGDFRAIPDLAFDIGLLLCDPPHVASRLLFDCTPAGTLFDLPVNGRRVAFAEHVFYTFRDDRIATVWSVIDKAAIAAQRDKAAIAAQLGEAPPAPPEPQRAPP